MPVRASGRVAGLLLLLATSGCFGAAPPGMRSDPPAHAWLEGVQWDTSAEWSVPLVEGDLEVLAPELVELRSQDGVAIGIAVWRPATEERVPVLVEAGPYYQDDMTADFYDVGYYVSRFVPHGYAYARVAVRGTGGSGGCQAFMDAAEQRDLDAAVTALGTQPWANGNVGLIGKSYDGSTPWMVAATGNPHVKTIVPISGLTSARDGLFPNGTVDTFLLTGVANYWRFMGLQHGSETPTSSWVSPDRWCASFPLAAPEFAAAAATGETGLADDAYWAERDFAPGVLANYNGSVFLVHGFDDTIVRPDSGLPLARALADRGQPVKILLGQWAHAYPDWGSDGAAVRWDFAEVLLRWFDRWLKDGTGPTGPAVDVQDEEGAWRTEETWPPADAVPTPLYLGDGVLSWTPEADAEVPVAAASIGGTGWPTFDLVLERDLHLGGFARVTLTLTPSTPNQAFLLTLADIDEDGQATRLSIARGSLAATAEGDVVPGQAARFRFQFQPADARLATGHTLRLHVTPITAGPPATAAVLEVGGEASVLELPLVARDGGDGHYPGQPQAG